MSNAYFEIPIPINEVIKEYKDGSVEKKELLIVIKRITSRIQLKIIFLLDISQGNLIRIRFYYLLIS